MKEIHFESIDSTQTYAKTHLDTFDLTKLTCITADEQTAGRGRFQRKWDSPKGVNLYVTYVFQMPTHTHQLTSLGQVLCTSVASLLLKEGLHPKIKWPNDIHLNRKKLSGILCELSFKGDEVTVIIGIGINVNTDDLSHIDQPATSLKLETGHSWDRAILLEKLHAQFTHDLSLFTKEGFAPFYPLFERLLAYKGEKIRCFDGKQTWEGVCHSITEDGELNLLLSDHTIHTVRAGDIKF